MKLKIIKVSACPRLTLGRDWGGGGLEVIPGVPLFQLLKFGSAIFSTIFRSVWVTGGHWWSPGTRTRYTLFIL